MELVDGTREAIELPPENVISSMPSVVITNILNRLPLQDAIRTGVLSRDWRSKWTLLTQLVFDEDFYQYLLKKECENCYGMIINRLFLHLEGAIAKFYVYMEEQCYSILDVEDVNNWVIFLSKNGIKDFTLINRGTFTT